MENKFKGSKGKFEVAPRFGTNGFYVRDENKIPLAEIDDKFDAELFADALNTIQNCDFMPSEFLIFAKKLEKNCDIYFRQVLIQKNIVKKLHKKYGHVENEVCLDVKLQYDIHEHSFINKNLQDENHELLKINEKLKNERDKLKGLVSNMEAGIFDIDDLIEAQELLTKIQEP